MPTQKRSMSTCRLPWLWAASLLLAARVTAGKGVDGYTSFGRGSCQDQRGKQYSYLQRIMTFPDAETCGKQECERIRGMDPASYRGFEYSVAKRCTCLFDIDEVPVVPNDANDPKYTTKRDNGNGPVTGVSGVSGTMCYQYGRNSGVMAGGMGGFYAAPLLALTTLFYVMI